MSTVDFIAESTRSKSQAQGSDGRLNTSSRSNKRIFYVSRDEEQAYSLTSLDASAAAGDKILYWQNTSATKKLFIDKILVGAVEAALWKVWFVTGTAAGSSALTPTNTNKTSSNAAAATSRGDGAITGLTEDGLIAATRSEATGHQDENFDDIIILGQNDAIAVEYDTGTTGVAEVTLWGYYE